LRQRNDTARTLLLVFEPQRKHNNVAFETKSLPIDESRLDTYRPGSPAPFSGIYRVFHAKQHAEPHSVTLLRGDYFPLCSECASFVRFELIFDAPYISSHRFFKDFS
jgi:hypothetical protein